MFCLLLVQYFSYKSPTFPQISPFCAALGCYTLTFPTFQVLFNWEGEGNRPWLLTDDNSCAAFPSPRLTTAKGKSKIELTTPSLSRLFTPVAAGLQKRWLAATGTPFDQSLFENMIWFPLRKSGSSSPRAAAMGASLSLAVGKGLKESPTLAGMYCTRLLFSYTLFSLFSPCFTWQREEILIAITRRRPVVLSFRDPRRSRPSVEWDKGCTKHDGRRAGPIRPIWQLTTNEVLELGNTFQNFPSSSLQREF